MSSHVLRIVEVGEPSNLTASDPAIIWIGIEFGALSFEAGSVIALKSRTFIDNYGLHWQDCFV